MQPGPRNDIFAVLDEHQPGDSIKAVALLHVQSQCENTFNMSLRKVRVSTRPQTITVEQRVNDLGLAFLTFGLTITRLPKESGSLWSNDDVNRMGQA